VLMAAAFPLAVIGNAFRLLLIVCAARWIGKSAGDFVHENIIFSLLPYLPVTLGLAWLTRSLTRLRVALAEQRAKERAK